MRKVIAAVVAAAVLVTSSVGHCERSEAIPLRGGFALSEIASGSALAMTKLSPESRFVTYSAEIQANGFDIRISRMLMTWAGIGCLIAASHPFIGLQVSRGFYCFKQDHPIWADTLVAVFFTAISDMQGQYLSDSPKKSFYQTLFLSVFAGLLFGWQLFFGYSWIEGAFETSLARGIAATSLRLSLSLQVAALIWIYKNKIQGLGADYRGYNQVKKKVDIDVITRPIYFLSDWYIQAWLPLWLKPWATMLVTFIVRPFSMWAQNQRKPFLNVIDRISAVPARLWWCLAFAMATPFLMGAAGGSSALGVLGVGTAVAVFGIVHYCLTSNMVDEGVVVAHSDDLSLDETGRLRQAGDILKGLDSGVLHNVLFGNGVVFRKARGFDSNPPCTLWMRNGSKVVVIDESLLEEGAPDAILAAALLYEAIKIQDSIRGDAGHYIGVVESRKQHKRALARVLFPPRGPRTTRARRAIFRWISRRTLRDGDNRFAEFVLRVADDVKVLVDKREADRIETAKERLRRILEKAEEPKKPKDSKKPKAFPDCDYSTLFYMVRAMVYHLYENERPLYRALIKRYPAPVIQAFAKKPESSFGEIGEKTGASFPRKLDKDSIALIDALLEDPMMRGRLEEAVAEKKRLDGVPRLEVSTDDLPLVAWTIYYMARDEGTSANIKRLIRLYPAIFNPRFAKFSFALRCRNVLQMVTQGMRLFSVFELLRKGGWNNSKPIPEKTASHAVKVALTNMVQFPEVREKFLEMKQAMAAPDAWPSRQRIFIRNKIIKAILRDMPEEQFERVLEDFHMLPRIQRLYKEPNIEREKEALRYFRMRDETPRARFGDDANVAKDAIRNAEKHPPYFKGN